MDYQKKIEEIEGEMERTTEAMKWNQSGANQLRDQKNLLNIRIKNYEDKVEELQEKMEKLQDQLNFVAAEQELMLVIHHLRRFFDHLKISDIDPQKEFLDYIRCVLAEQIEGEIDNISNFLKEASEKIEEKL